MGTYSGSHDAYYIIDGLTQSLPVTSATGTSTTPFGTQTRAVQVVAAGNVSSNALLYVKFYSPGVTSQASSTVDAPVVLNWPQVFKINPGQRASVISGDATASYRAY
jgi:hypothetical protein